MGLIPLAAPLLDLWLHLVCKCELGGGAECGVPHPASVYNQDGHQQVIRLQLLF